MRERERERERRLEEVNMVFETIGESLVVVFVSSNSYISQILQDTKDAVKLCLLISSKHLLCNKII